LTTRLLTVAVLALFVSGCASAPKSPVDAATVRRAFAGRQAAFVLMDAQTGEALRVNEALCRKPLPPCSTFKIWNTMIALELGLVSSPDEPFYTWDGQKRFLDAWNQNLTLARAFAVSCVPAFQALAQRIGPERMQEWLDRVNYGDRDTSAGVAEFWLPRPSRKTILISADEQAALLRRLTLGELSFAPGRVAVLRQIMRVRATPKGELFGKTGTGQLADGSANVAWFVGWVESGADRKTRVFACVALGEGLTGLNARAMVESILESGGLL